jgi:hypothetical protein
MHHHLRRACVVAGSLVLAGTLTVTQPASAGGRHGHGHDHSHDPVVVATGLDNPRQLSFDGNDLYVAEGGTGGDVYCLPGEGPEGGQQCLGFTGAVTKVSRRGQWRVLDGLPSIAATDGSSAGGPSDVAVRDGGYALLMGLGAAPADRDELAAVSDETADAALFGTLLVGSLGRSGTWGPFVLSDVSAYEASDNPQGDEIDTNPVGLYADDDSFVVADAGGNDVLRVDYRGAVSTLATFDPTGWDAVPTSAVPGPDGALYVSQLTGFPFPAGEAKIFRIAADGTVTTYAEGLTNVTDLGWYDGRLYAVQLADEGLLGGEEGAPPSGSLVRVSPRGNTTVADDLVAPYGLALSRGSAYVTTCSVCADEGQVVKIRLK